MTNSLPLIDADSRNMSLRFSFDGNSLFFTVTRFDGGVFTVSPAFSDALNFALEQHFIEIADLFEVR
jgi:hypothetical protein